MRKDGEHIKHESANRRCMRIWCSCALAAGHHGAIREQGAGYCRMKTKVEAVREDNKQIRREKMRRLIVSCGLLITLLLGYSTNAYSDDTPPGKRYIYKHSDGQPQALEIYFPQGHDPSTAKVPCVLLFHGGAWGGGDLKQFRKFCRYFASRGLVAATANYRLFPADKRDTLPAGESRKQFCIIDAKSAIRWMKQHAEELGIDPMRVITGGGSAGGHISILATINPGLNDPADPKEFDTRVVAYLLFNPALTAFDANFPKVDALRHLKADFAPAIVFFGTEDKWKQGWDAAHVQLKILGAGDRIHLWLAEDAGHSFFGKNPWKDLVLIEADRFLVSQGLLEGQPNLQRPVNGKKLMRANGVDSQDNVERARNIKENIAL